MENNNKQQGSITTGNYVMLVAVTLAFPATYKAAYYVKHKLRLNKVIKDILLIMAYTNSISLTFILIADIMMLVFGKTDQFTCFLLTLSTVSILEFNMVMSSMISILRYFIACKMKKHKIIPANYFKIYIISATMLPILHIAFKVYVSAVYGYSKLNIHCTEADISKYEGNLLQRITSGSMILGSISCTVGFDLKMWILVKQTHTVHSSDQLVPWKSNSHQEAEDIKVNDCLNAKNRYNFIK